jgi:spermidine/putrescine transport system permease protein
MLSTAEAAQDTRSRRRGWMLTAPALVLLSIAAAGPLLVMLVYSFLTPGEYGNVVWDFSLRGWREILWSEDIFEPGKFVLADQHLTILWRSIKLSVATTVLTCLIGFPTAWFIATKPPRARLFWLFLITIPFWTNLLIRTFAINEVIRQEGVLNTFLIWAGLISDPLRIIYTDTAVFIGMTYVYLPFMVLPIFAAIDRFDMRLLEAGYDLYASRARVLRHIILPIVKPGIVAGSMLVFTPSLGAYVIPRILGGGKNMMIGNFIDLQFGQGRNWPLGAALAMTLLIIVGVALTIYTRMTSRQANHG